MLDRGWLVIEHGETSDDVKTANHNQQVRLAYFGK
jgi:hypothetical protein